MLRRRAWNRGLAPGAIKEYEVVTASRTRQLIHRLQEQIGEVNLGDWMNRFTCGLLHYHSYPGSDDTIDSYDFMSDMA